MSHMDAVGLPLFAPIPPSVPCATSEAAAERQERTGKAGRDRRRILAYLRTRPDGATEQEIGAALDLTGDVYRPRIRELGHGVGVQCGLGLIERTEEQRVTLGHQPSFIWRIR